MKHLHHLLSMLLQQRQPRLRCAFSQLVPNRTIWFQAQELIKAVHSDA